MKAEIISIGDELTDGKIQDTNSSWLSRELGDLGIRTLYHTTVGDELDAIVDVFRTAVSRVDLILATGGLGPTADDLTREAIAKAARVPLIRDDTLLETIRDMFKRRGREMPLSNEAQALLPFGATAIHNPNGTAPGIDLTINRTFPEGEDTRTSGLRDSCRLFAVPGVPAEMKEMFRGTVGEALQHLIDDHAGRKRVIRSRTIHCFGIGESQAEAMLPDIINRNRTPRVGITANAAVISLRIMADTPSEQECREQIRETAEIIYRKLGDFVYGEDEDRLQDVVCRKLKTAGQTLAVVEAGTRGLLTGAIASGDGAEAVFQGGLVLAGTPDIEEMIAKTFSLWDVDIVLAVGPYGPSGQTTVAFAERPPAGASGPGDSGLGRVVAEAFPRTGHPALIDDLFVRRAMDLLRRR
ncbi:MAG TPA: damage-inducible protein CinA [Planctomycetaceae bacterium]|nr:damage-inducible protein CinA [Planctomycetaceae bacterium]